MLKQMQDGLGVRTCGVVHTGLFQFEFQRRVIEHLAVVRQHVSSVARVHRLMPVRHIDDAQAPVPEGNVLLDKNARSIGAAVRKRVPHALNGSVRNGSRRRGWNHDTANSAHGSRC